VQYQPARAPAAWCEESFDLELASESLSIEPLRRISYCDRLELEVELPLDACLGCRRLVMQSRLQHRNSCRRKAKITPRHKPRAKADPVRHAA